MPLDLKSGMPEAVLMPAPVWNTTLVDCQTSCASSHTFLSSSSGVSKICGSEGKGGECIKWDPPVQGLVGQRESNLS